MVFAARGRDLRTLWFVSRGRSDLNAKRKHVKKVSAQINRILFEDWNPLGVEVEDEYEGYVGAVHHVLLRGASQEELIELLNALEHEEGLASSRAIKVSVADKLLKVELTPD